MTPGRRVNPTLDADEPDAGPHVGAITTYAYDAHAHPLAWTSLQGATCMVLGSPWVASCRLVAKEVRREGDPRNAREAGTEEDHRCGARRAR